MILKRLILFMMLFSLASYGADATNGAKLFDGTKEFENGGVACVSCHNANSDEVISGGNLAMDLSSMGGAVATTLSSVDVMSSPIMKRAYKENMVTKAEAEDIDAFLMSVASHPGEGYGSHFVIAGLILAIILYLLLSLLNKRKTLGTSVNQELYDRQTKATWRS